MLGRLLLIAVPVIACVMSASAAACACGIALDATVTGERALVIEHPGREEIVAGFDLERRRRARDRRASGSWRPDDRRDRARRSAGLPRRRDRDGGAAVGR